MYATSEGMLQKASEGGYAVGAFNAENAEMVAAIISAAEEARAPVMIQTTPGTLRYLGPAYFAGMVGEAAAESTAEVALHLDHGSSYELAMDCVRLGYTSVMIDGSALPFEENVALSARVCAEAVQDGIPVEAELGVVGGKEDDTVAEGNVYTDPGEAAAFVERTGVSSLAIAVGTAHGFYAVAPQLNLALIPEVKKRVPVPLVLHGASGLADEVVAEAVKLGMAKVNFATELRGAYTGGVRAHLQNDPDCYDPKAYGKAGMAAVKELVLHKMQVCGCVGRG